MFVLQIVCVTEPSLGGGAASPLAVEPRGTISIDATPVMCDIVVILCIHDILLSLWSHAATQKPQQWPLAPGPG